MKTKVTSSLIFGIISVICLLIAAMGALQWLILSATFFVMACVVWPGKQPKKRNKAPNTDERKYNSTKKSITY